MTFEEAVAFLDDRIQHGIHPGLDRVAALVELLDHPQRTYPAIHVTGTNGKYSVAAMTTALLTELGLTCGQYASPHVESILERISVGGTPIDREGFASVLDYLVPYIELVEKERDDKLTYFETLTAMALEHFFDLPVHAAVIEVGLGGEYDATNVVDARVAVITKIARDHDPEFGEDLHRAVWEKAGIIKQGAVALSGILQPDLQRIVDERAQERGAARVALFGTDFGVAARSAAVGGQVLRVSGMFAEYDDLFVPLYGEHQAANAAFAITAAEAFGGGALDREGVVHALAGISLPARLEVVSRRPLVVIDGGHNPDAATAVVSTLQNEFIYRRIICVVGMLEDKAVEDVLALLERATDKFVVSAPIADRAADVERLRSALAGADVETAPTVADAVSIALSEAAEDDLVLIFGSFYTAGEARAFLRSHGRLSQS